LYEIDCGVLFEPLDAQHQQRTDNGYNHRRKDPAQSRFFATFVLARVNEQLKKSGTLN
jgi:hypothetical protein